MRKGFTLTELTVVIGILSIIVLVVAQPITNIIKYQRDSQQSDNVRDNVQFILNVMDKELRTSSNLSINASGALSFKDQSGANVVYAKAGNIIKKSSADYTDASVFTVENLSFFIQAGDGGSVNNNSPGTIVTTVITAKSVDGKDTVTMQSTTMPRNNSLIPTPILTPGEAQIRCDTLNNRRSRTSCNSVTQSGDIAYSAVKRSGIWKCELTQAWTAYSGYADTCAGTSTGFEGTCTDPGVISSICSAEWGVPAGTGSSVQGFQPGGTGTCGNGKYHINVNCVWPTGTGPVKDLP
jgi:prepilin-type N-terminal cleavage/methylation domain-containing protein